MNKRKISYYILSFLGVALGILLFVYAGVDDSPGGQLIGVFLVVFSVVYLIKTLKNS